MRVLLMIAVLAVPLAHAQPAKIGVLAFDQRSDSLRESFSRSLREQGLTDGKDFSIIWRSAGGQIGQADQIAAEFVRLKVDVIVAPTTPAIRAAQKATTTIPIVMAPSGDPIAAGFVTSLGRPGGNITGVSNVIVDVGGKLLGLLREIQPNVSRVAVLLDRRTALAKPFMDDVQVAAGRSGVHIVPIWLNGPQDAAEAFRTVQKEKAQAVVVMPLLATKDTADVARQHRTMSISTGMSSHAFPRVGGLIGYGTDPAEHYQRAAVYVAKILRGAKPASLPIEQSTTFELVVNMKTARALGLTIPKDMLVRANEVIE